MKLSVLLLLVCFSFSGFSPIFTKGIDLVALKKQEEERRKKVSKSIKSVNDTNINKISSGGKSYGFVQMESEGTTAAETVSTNNENQTDETKQPDFWKKQQIELTTRIAELKESINNEQKELSKLWSDFYLKSIPAEQTAIKVQISQLTNQSEQKKIFLSESEAKLEELHEKARKAGVPPGWLR